MGAAGTLPEVLGGMSSAPSGLTEGGMLAVILALRIGGTTLARRDLAFGMESSRYLWLLRPEPRPGSDW